MADEDLPEHVRRAAEAAHRDWRIGDDGEGRLHAALVVAASLIRADERERPGAIPLSETLTDEQVAEFRERFEAAVANPGPLRVLSSDGWRVRTEAAEARLAEIEAHASAIVDALRHALSYVEHVPNPSSQAAAERYRSALAIISAGQEPS